MLDHEPRNERLRPLYTSWTMYSDCPKTLEVKEVPVDSQAMEHLLCFAHFSAHKVEYLQGGHGSGSQHFCVKIFELTQGAFWSKIALRILSLKVFYEAVNI